MANRTVNVIRNIDVEYDKLHFQYFPSRFIREVYGGNDEDKLLIKHSPHYDLLVRYQNIGNKVLDLPTNYYKMQSQWGRKDGWIHGKTSKFLNMYEHIKRNGPIGRVSIVEDPLYERVFEDGYEIYDGHHRASIYVALGYEIIKCKVVTVKFK